MVCERTDNESQEKSRYNMINTQQWQIAKGMKLQEEKNHAMATR